MGSPPAPCLANIWLFKREPEIKDYAKLFERHMDDVIRSIYEHKIEEEVQHINSIDENLQFTVEREEEGKIAFIDMRLIREGRRLSSTWYNKPTDTGLIMNFHAFAPKRYKRSVVGGFVHRIHRACSTWENFHQSLEKAKGILEKNQYPPNFYDLIKEAILAKIHNPAEEEKERVCPEEDGQNVQMKHRILLKYRGTPTDQFVKRLKECGAPTQVVLTLRKVKTCLPSLKPTIPKMLKNNVVYKITCPRCEACYVGKTSRRLCIRYREERTKSAEPVFKHMEKCGGAKQLKEEHIKVLATITKGTFHLAIMEALNIRENCPAINTRDEYRNHKLSVKF